MFAVDPSLRYIEMPEQDLAALYRSAGTAVVPVPGAPPLLCEAFVCKCMTDQQPRYFGALVESNGNRVLIYTTGSVADNTLDAALTLFKDMGFRMEPVDLSYGRALREVIIKSIKIFRAPSGGMAPQERLTEKDAGPMESPGRSAVKGHSDDQAGKKVQAAGHGGVPQAPTASADEAKSLELQRLLKEKQEAEKLAGERAELSRIALKAAQEEEAELRRVLAEKIAAEKRAEQQADAAREMYEKAEKRRLEREKLLHEKAEAERREAEQTESVRRAHEIIEAEQIEHERLLASKIAAERRAEEQAEAARVAVEKMQAARLEREKLLKQAAEAEKRAVKAEAERVEREQLLQEQERARQAALDEAAERVREQEAKALRDRQLADQAAQESAKRKERDGALEKMRQDALEKAQAELSSCEALLARQVEAEINLSVQAESARVAVERAAGERVKLEGMVAVHSATEKAEAGRIEAARGQWERGEAERLASEDALMDMREAERLAEEQVRAATRLLEQASSKRMEGEKTLAEKEHAQERAAQVVTGTEAAREKCQVDLRQAETALLAAADQELQAGEQFEAVRRMLDNTTAERVRAERLLKELHAAEQRLKEEATEELQRPEQAVECPAADQIPVVASPAESAPEAPVTATSSVDVKEKGRPGPRNDVDKFAQDLAEAARQSLAGPSEASEAGAVADQQSAAIAGKSRENSADPFFEMGNPGGHASFSVDSSLHWIEFTSEEEVKALHQSLNTVMLTVEGFGSENCSAYLVAVEHGGTSSVFFALHLRQSNRALIYVPDMEPVTPQACAGVIEDGINFAETVGFMMDRIGMEHTGERSKILANGTIFHMTRP